MPDEVDEVRRRIEAHQRLPTAQCTRCSSVIGIRPRHYARLELKAEGVIFYLPLCQDCIDKYLAMARAEAPKH